MEMERGDRVRVVKALPRASDSQSTVRFLKAQVGKDGTVNTWSRSSGDGEMVFEVRLDDDTVYDFLWDELLRL